MKIAASVGVLLFLYAEAIAAPGWSYAREERISEGGTVTRHFIVNSNGSFSFVPPRGWQMTIDANEGTVTLWSSGLIAGKVFIRALDAKPGARVDWGQWREKTQRTHAPAAITGEWPAVTASGTGNCIDLLWPSKNGAHQAGSIAMVPFNGAPIEFTLTTGREYFAEYKARFISLLNSARLEARSQMQETITASALAQTTNAPGATVSQQAHKAVAGSKSPLLASDKVRQ